MIHEAIVCYQIISPNSLAQKGGIQVAFLTRHLNWEDPSINPSTLRSSTEYTLKTGCFLKCMLNILETFQAGKDVVFSNQVI